MGNSYHYTCLRVIGSFLSKAYVYKDDHSKLPALLEIMLEDWPQYSTIATNNSVLTNIVSVIVEQPALFGRLDNVRKAEFKSLYLNHWRRSELIKKQLANLSETLCEYGSKDIMLMKGGIYLLEKLYPTSSHRYMIDIDVYYQDLSVIEALALNGYESTDNSKLDISALDIDKIRSLEKEHHHLPAIFSTTETCFVELHHSMLHLRANKYEKEDVYKNSIQTSDFPKIRIPALVDQFILALLHIRLSDFYSDAVKFKMRNMLDTFLLWKRMSSCEKQLVARHFRCIGRATDFELWEMICTDWFGIEHITPSKSKSAKFWYQLNKRLGQNQRANSIAYVLFTLIDTLFTKIWSRAGLKNLFRKLRSPERRAIIKERIFKIFKN